MKHKKRKTRARKGGGEGALRSIGKSVLIALPITLAVTALLILPVTALLLCTANPDAYHTAAGLALLYVAALLGGALATRLHHRRAPLLCGAAMGGTLLLLLTLLALILPDANHTYTPALRVGLYALLVPCTVLGALLGARERSARPRRHR